MLHMPPYPSLGFFQVFFYFPSIARNILNGLRQGETGSVSYMIAGETEKKLGLVIFSPPPTYTVPGTETAS